MDDAADAAADADDAPQNVDDADDAAAAAVGVPPRPLTLPPLPLLRCSGAVTGRRVVAAVAGVSTAGADARCCRCFAVWGRRRCCCRRRSSSSQAYDALPLPGRRKAAIG